MPAYKSKKIQLIPRQQFLDATTALAIEIEEKTGDLPTCKTKGSITSDGVLNGFTWESINIQVKLHGLINLTNLFISKGIKNPSPVKEKSSKTTPIGYIGSGSPTISGHESREALKTMALAPPLVSVP